MSDTPIIEPLPDDELAALPVFPLPRVVFFPGTILPLHLFEPRYRAMMEDCVSSGPKAMAVALLKPGWDDDYEGAPPIHEIAGAGRIVEWSAARTAASTCSCTASPASGSTSSRTIAPTAAPAPRRSRIGSRTSTRSRHAAAGDPDRLLGSRAGARSFRSSRWGWMARRRRACSPTASPIGSWRTFSTGKRLLEQADVKVRLALVHDALLELLARLAPEDGPLH